MELEIKQKQSLALTTAMQQALLVLQLPLVELAAWIKLQIEQNPILQYEEERGEGENTPAHLELDFEKRSFEVLDELDETFKEALFSEHLTSESPTQSELPLPPSLSEHLMRQAKEAFSSPEELKKAEEIIGNLDGRGFIGDLAVDCKILETIQTFDPPGIAARHLQDSLLIQLRLKGKENSIAYQIIAHHFEDLSHNRLPELAKKLKILVSHIQPLLSRENLDFSPTDRFEAKSATHLIPDVYLEKVGNTWQITVNESYLPRITLSPPPEQLLDSDEERAFVRAHVTQGKWLLRTLQRRCETLKRIVQAILRAQLPFFEGEQNKLTPMTLQEVAASLSLHESTVARAVSGKYLSCLQGIFSLRSFFTHALQTSTGKKISNRTARELMSHLIDREDKKKPLSDEALASALAKEGVPCARRTITKYRKNLRIPAAARRRRWS